MRIPVVAAIVAFVALITAPVAGAHLPARADNETTVLVSVAAPDSAPLRTLAATDFRLLEDKNPVEVTAARLATDPMSIVLVVDLARPAGMLPPTQDLRHALRDFVGTVLAAEPDAQIAILQVANSATPLVDFTSNAAALQAPIELITSQALPGSVMLEGVIDASRRLATRPAPRRAIVCVNFGSTEGGSLQPKTVAEEVKKSGATLWTVSVEASYDKLASTRENVWNTVPAATGGMRETSVEVSGLGSNLKRVANTLLSQYTVTFARKANGPLTQLKGETTNGAKVLPTRWAH
ncbi:MAG TPA: hypothetical protein VG871_23315 [Vicinamibacterales bacterium]|nr:hypothetical protein [Vicinamibacterales bacterium]